MSNETEEQQLSALNEARKETEGEEKEVSQSKPSGSAIGVLSRWKKITPLIRYWYINKRIMNGDFIAFLELLPFFGNILAIPIAFLSKKPEDKND